MALEIENQNLQNFMYFNSRVLTETMDWAVGNPFKIVWFDEKWNKPAKGGEGKFSHYHDMDYVAHIFSGTALAMRVLDYFCLKNPETEFNSDELKRSILCYFFHDYNKLTEENYKMYQHDGIKELINGNIKNLLDTLNLTIDNLFQVAFSTETGTSFQILRNTNSTNNMKFESSFSRLADSLSSKFNKPDIVDYNKDIYFNNSPVVPGSKIKKIDFTSTQFYACTDLVKKSIVDLIEKTGNFYLWNTNNSIYYVNDGINFDKKMIKEAFINKLNNALLPENLLTFNDRRVMNSADGIVPFTRNSLIKYVENNNSFKNCIWLEDIKLSEQNISSAVKYSTKIDSMLKSFSINYRMLVKDYKEKSLRDGLKLESISEEDMNYIDERLRVFAIRYIQLSSDFSSSEVKKVKELLKKQIGDYENDILKGLIGKIPEKSGLLIPLIINEDRINWSLLIDEIISNLNKDINSVEFDEVIDRILSITSMNNVTDIEIPEVPDKSKMSMINGYPAKESATTEKLFGLNTQTFNNRLLTSGIGYGKIDKWSKLEFAVRRNIVPGYRGGGECIMYMSFPGAIPFLDMSNYIEYFNFSNQDEIGYSKELKLSIDQINIHTKTVSLDSAFFYTISEIKTNEQILKQLYNALKTYKSTKMLVKLSYSNSPLFEDQYEAIRIEIGNVICSTMKWDKIRCNNIDKVLQEIIVFNVLSNGSLSKLDFKKTSETIMGYITTPMSLFIHIHEQASDKNGKYKIKTQLSTKIQDIRKLAYESEKDGGNKMKNITELAGIAAKLVRPKWDMSGNKRTWMLRDSLEVLEKSIFSVSKGVNRDISDFEMVIEGYLLENLERDKVFVNDKTIQLIKDFSKKLINLLKEDFNSKIPSGSMRSYLIYAFEFEYMDSNKKEGEN